VKSQALVLLLTLAAMAAGIWGRPLHGQDDAFRTIDVVGSNFKFEPAAISVTEGERVRLRVRSMDRPHSVAIKAFHVKALTAKPGETVSLEFVADKAGTFEFACAEYCGTGHAGMKGTLVVVPRKP
jgi:heme/copper-type cytochrome/quinol oxidase subunit 2